MSDMAEEVEFIRQPVQSKYSGKMCPRCKSEGIQGEKRPPAEGIQKNEAWEVTN